MPPKTASTFQTIFFLNCESLILDIVTIMFRKYKWITELLDRKKGLSEVPCQNTTCGNINLLSIGPL